MFARLSRPVLIRTLGYVQAAALLLLPVALGLASCYSSRSTKLVTCVATRGNAALMQPAQKASLKGWHSRAYDVACGHAERRISNINSSKSLLLRQIGMEMWARYAHKALWHDFEPGWRLHKSHHVPRLGPFEDNDVFAIINAVPAMGLCAYGYITPNVIGGVCPLDVHVADATSNHACRDSAMSG